jgi:hypothetical protein
MTKAAKKHTKLCAVVLYIALACTCAFSSVLAHYSITKTATASAQLKEFGVTATTTANTGVVLAPGGSGTLASVSVSGTPSVDAYVLYSVSSVTLGTWQADSAFYCPVKINVFGTEIDGRNYGNNQSGFINAIKAIKYQSGVLPANTPLEAHSQIVTWSWPAGTTTTKDNQLLGKNATIQIVVTAQIIQVH